MAAAEAMGECEATRHKRKKKKPNPDHVEFGVASKPLPPIPILQTPAPGTPILEEAAAGAARRKMRKADHKLHLAKNPTFAHKMRKTILQEEGTLKEHLGSTQGTTSVPGHEVKPVRHETPQVEEQGDRVVLATKKTHKERKSSPSLSAAKIPILEQEPKVTKKQKLRKQQDPSGNSPLPLDPGQVQPQGTNAPHASKPLPPTPFLVAATEVAVMKRKMREEQEVATLSLAQNITLEEQREDAMMTKMKKKHKERESSPSTSMVVEITIWEQEAKLNKKQKLRKHQEASGKSPLSLDPGQTRSHGGKAPLEQEQEADGRKGSGTKKSNRKPRVRVLSKRELIKEASKKQPVLPEGFVAFSDFVPSCTEQNFDNPPPHIAFFDQFRYKPVCGDHKPPLPRTPDRLSRLTGNENYRASNSNTSVASKTKQQDLGSGSQEKLNAQGKPSEEAKETIRQFPAN